MNKVGKIAYWFSWPVIFVHGMFRKTARVIVVVEDKVLLVNNWLGNGSWSLPGGGKKFGELLEKTARRELSEELGINLTRYNLEYVGFYKSREDYIVKNAEVYKVVLTAKPVVKLSHELTGYSWQKINNAKSKQTTSDSTREILDRAMIL